MALTFDDGPALPFTVQILEILRARGAPATFVVCGQNVERYPEIVCRIHAEGHTLGNHTYSHPFLYLQSRKKIAEEIDRTQDLLEKLTGYRPTLFRPPYGARWFGLYPVLRERGMRVVQWSDTGYDGESGAEAIVTATLQHLRPGSVILLHDGCREQHFEPGVVKPESTFAELGIDSLDSDVVLHQRGGEEAGAGVRRARSA